MSTVITVPAPVARRNLVLGLVLGAVVVGFIVLWMVAFTRGGLPKDPEVWKKLQEGRVAGAEVKP